MTFRVINCLLCRSSVVEGDCEPESGDDQSYAESDGESSGFNYSSASESQEYVTDEDQFVNPFDSEYAAEDESSENSESSESIEEDSNSGYSDFDDVFGWESDYVPNPENEEYVNSFGIDEEDASNYYWGDDSYDSSEFYESFFGDSYDDWSWDIDSWMEDDWFGDDWSNSWDTDSWFSDDWLSEGGYSDDWLDAGGYGDEENFFGSGNANGGGWFSNLDPNSPLSLAVEDENSSLSLALDDPNSMISQALNDPNSSFSLGIDDPNSELGQLLNDPNALATIDFTDPDSFVKKFFGT